MNAIKLIFCCCLVLACNKKLKKSDITNVSKNEFKGEIIRSIEDTTNLIFTVTNLTTKEIRIPKELGSWGNALSFTLPSGLPSQFKNPNGSIGIPYILQPNENFSYQINNYEHFMITLSSIEKDQPGWFTLHWKMDKLNINESISIYYDYEKIRKNLD